MYQAMVGTGYPEPLQVSVLLSTLITALGEPTTRLVILRITPERITPRRLGPTKASYDKFVNQRGEKR